VSDLTVILDRKELVVRMESKSIRVDRPDGPLERIPLEMIGRLILIGSPMVSCDVWRALAEQNIPAVLLPSRGGGVSAHMGAGLSATITTRIAQYMTAHDTQDSLSICQWLLDKKLQAQESVVKKLGNSEPELESICAQIKSCREGLQKADSRNSLMGHEGAAASAYFTAFAKILPEKWNFNGRNRRLPRDPVNALLSLSYVMTGGEVRRAILQRGLDPALGFLHAPQSGRENLVLDILEPLRPKVDRFVLQLLDSSLNLKHFTTNDQDGCLLNKKGRNVFFRAWAKWQEPDGENKRTLKSMAENFVRDLIAFFPDADFHQS
jgi:CRISP-associated protein Cas1